MWVELSRTPRVLWLLLVPPSRFAVCMSRIKALWTLNQMHGFVKVIQFKAKSRRKMEKSQKLDSLTVSLSFTVDIESFGCVEASCTIVVLIIKAFCQF